MQQGSFSPANSPITMVSPEAVAMISSANTAALMTTAIRAEQQQRMDMSAAVSTPVDGRDPVLVALEGHLMENLKASDVQMDDDGVLLFNVNQVAYLAENCKDKEEQKNTKRRIKAEMHKINVVTRRCKRTGNGKDFLHCMK